MIYTKPGIYQVDFDQGVLADTIMSESWCQYNKLGVTSPRECSQIYPGNARQGEDVYPQRRNKPHTW